MSIYMVNKFMRAVEMSDQAVREYVADPAAFIDRWLAAGSGPDSPTDDRRLSAAEREAFVARDYAALYGLGAHPYLLWHFTEAVYTPQMTWPELNRRYREAVEPQGYPDFIV